MICSGAQERDPLRAGGGRRQQEHRVLAAERGHGDAYRLGLAGQVDHQNRAGAEDGGLPSRAAEVGHGYQPRTGTGERRPEPEQAPAGKGHQDDVTAPQTKFESGVVQRRARKDALRAAESDNARRITKSHILKIRRPRAMQWSGDTPECRANGRSPLRCRG